MPRLSVWLIRSALLHLLVGFAIGAAILWQKGPGGMAGAWRWLPLHIHLVLVGWTVQLAMGVAYWILPRFALKDPALDRVRQARGRPALAWASFALLNASTVAALAGGAWGNAASGVLAAGAALAFALHGWPRVKRFMA